MTDDLDFGLSRILDSWARGQIHTCMPGTVTAFTDRGTPQVSVRPGFKRLKEGADVAEDLPIIENVPVVYPGGSDYMIVFDLPVDSPVLLVFTERSIGSWMQQGGSADPALDHMFDLSDAIAIPGLIPHPSELPTDVIEDGIEIRNRDGDVYIKIDGSVITVDNSDATIELDANKITIDSGDDGVITLDSDVISIENSSGDIELKSNGQVAINGTNLTVDA